MKGIRSLLIAIIAMIIFYNIYKQGSEDQSTFYKKLVLKNYYLEFKGVIIQVNRESKDDNYNTIRVENYDGREELYFFDYEGSGFLNYFQIGDSIIKLKNQNFLTVRRNGVDTKVELKLDGYKYYDEYINNPDSIISKHLKVPLTHD